MTLNDSQQTFEHDVVLLPRTFWRTSSHSLGQKPCSSFKLSTCNALAGRTRYSFGCRGLWVIVEEVVFATTWVYYLLFTQVVFVAVDTALRWKLWFCNALAGRILYPFGCRRLLLSSRGRSVQLLHCLRSCYLDQQAGMVFRWRFMQL